MTATLEPRTPKKRISEQEYLEFEERSETRHEFVDGTMLAMAGESQLHNDIAGAIYAALLPVARAKRCRIAIGTMRVRVPSGRIRYPDVFVACPPGGDAYVEETPCFIVEVISASTEKTDRGAKLEEYTNINSLERYLIVEQVKKQVSLYRRTKQGWLFEVISEPGVMDVPCLETTLSFDTIYAGLELPGEAEESEAQNEKIAS